MSQLIKRRRYQRDYQRRLRQRRRDEAAAAGTPIKRGRPPKYRPVPDTPEVGLRIWDVIRIWQAWGEMQPQPMCWRSFRRQLSKHHCKLPDAMLRMAVIRAMQLGIVKRSRFSTRGWPLVMRFTVPPEAVYYGD